MDEVLSFLDGALTAEERAPLEAHLAECAGCRALVSELARPEDTTHGPAQKAPSSAAEAAPLLPGERIGRYEIVRPLGAGAMGQVFLATDPELKRAVAIKRLHDAEEHSPFLEREAQALARLRHPNVVAVHDVGGEGSRRFVALEYVQGQTLTDWLQTPRSLPQILEAFHQAGEGLAAAHAAGLVHRDFKPDNVLVGDDGVAKVSDFGLARAQPSSPHRATGLLSTQLSSHQHLIGTPRYMSPEIFSGKAADAKSDQFAFCVSLWEALAGERPFDGNDVPSLRAAVLEGAPRPLPSSHRMPGWLKPILLRGLSRDPKRRFPSMSALLRAVDQARAKSEEPRRLVARALLGALCVSLLTLGLVRSGLLSAVESRAQGELLVATRRPWNDDVRVVVIDEATLQRNHWAVPRLDLARVLEGLRNAGAKAVVLAGYLQSPASDGPEGDRALLRAMAGRMPVVLASACSSDERLPSPAANVRGDIESEPAGPTPAKPCARLVLPPHALSPALFAQAESARSSNGALIGVYGLLESDGMRVPTLSLAAFARANGATLQQKKDRLVVGSSELFVDPTGVVRASFRIPFVDQIESFGDLVAALSPGGSPHLPPALARQYHGRYVLIGSTAETTHDLGVFADGRRAPSMLLHGQLLSDLLEHRPIRPMDPVLLWLWVLAFSAVSGMAALGLRLSRVPWALIVPCLGEVGLAVGFAREGVIGSPVATAVGIAASFGVALALRLSDLEGNRRQLGVMVQAQLESGATGARAISTFARDGARKVGSVLAARHPQALLASGTPEGALALTRELLEDAARAVWEEQGRVESARVDQLLAVFEAGGRAQHAQAAARVANRLAAQGWTCAVATEELVVGRMGLPGVPHYGVVGPAVAEALALLARAEAGSVTLNPQAKARSGNRPAVPRDAATLKVRSGKRASGR